MDLRSHLTEIDGRVARDGAETVRIATFCHVSPNYLFMVAGGYKTASPELAANIEHATSGNVDRRITLPEFPWDAPSRQQQSNAA